MSFFGFGSRHVAIFKDNKGDQIGSKVFERVFFSSSLGLRKRYFFYKDGAYNVKPIKTARIEMNKNRVFLNDCYYVYNIDNPDPLDYSDNAKPITDPRDYKVRLENKLIDELNRAGRGKLNIPWKWIIIIGLGLIVAYYFLSGGTLFGSPEEVTNITAGGVPK